MDFSPEEHDVLAHHRPRKASRWDEPDHHLRIYAILDHGAQPALGELMMGASADPAATLEGACRLARSASIRAGLLGMSRAGAAVVVLPHPELDLEACRGVLHDRLANTPVVLAPAEEFAGDAADLGAPVLDDEQTLARVRGRLLVACLEPVLAPGRSWDGLRAMVLGAGPRGRDAVVALRDRKLAVTLWDEDPAKAETLASRLGVSVADERGAEAATDLLVPCTAKPPIDRTLAETLAARVTCGLVPRLVTDPEARGALEARGHWLIPELLSSAAEMIVLGCAQGLLDEDEAVALVEQTAAQVLDRPEGAHQRTFAICVERSKAAG